MNPIIVTPAAVDSPSLMTLATARVWGRNNLRNGNDTTLYPDTKLDQAIQSVCFEFSHVVRPSKKNGSVALDANTATFDASALTDLDLTHAMECYILGQADQVLPVGPLQMVEATQLWKLQQDNPDMATGTPKYIAFDSQTSLTGSVFPAPSTACALKILYTVDFAMWTPGTSSPDAVTLNLDPGLLTQILPWGVPAYLHKHEPENAAYAALCAGKYQEVQKSLVGHGNLGARTAERQTTRQYSGGGRISVGA